MKTENQLVQFVKNLRFQDIPCRALETVNNMLTAVAGATIAGDQHNPDTVTGRLGEEFRLNNIVFKKYPGCGLAQGVTELAPALTAEHDLRGHTAVDLGVATVHDLEFFSQLDHAPGFPENPLSDQEHLQRFRDCLDFAVHPPSKPRAEKIINSVQAMETLPEAGQLIALMT